VDKPYVINDNLFKMLTMRWKNGRIKYSYEPQNTSTSQLSIVKDMLHLPPLPHAHFIDTTTQKKKIQRWYNKHYHYVDDIIDILLEAFYAFLETRPIYQTQFNEMIFRQAMIETLYRSSFSAYKNFV
jgi:hypothetical protein